MSKPSSQIRSNTNGTQQQSDLYSLNKSILQDVWIFNEDILQDIHIFKAWRCWSTARAQSVCADPRAYRYYLDIINSPIGCTLIVGTGIGTREPVQLVSKYKYTQDDPVGSRKMIPVPTGVWIQMGESSEWQCERVVQWKCERVAVCVASRHEQSKKALSNTHTLMRTKPAEGCPPSVFAQSYKDQYQSVLVSFGYT